MILLTKRFNKGAFGELSVLLYFYFIYLGASWEVNAHTYYLKGLAHEVELKYFDKSG